MICVRVLEKLDLLAVANQGRRHQRKTQGLCSGRRCLHTRISKRSYAFERDLRGWRPVEDPMLELWEKKSKKQRVAEKGKHPAQNPTTEDNVQGVNWRLARGEERRLEGS